MRDLIKLNLPNLVEDMTQLVRRPNVWSGNINMILLNEQGDVCVFFDMELALGFNST